MPRQFNLKHNSISFNKNGFMVLNIARRKLRVKLSGVNSATG
jgi:hypothetical protein